MTKMAGWDFNSCLCVFPFCENALKKVTPNEPTNILSDCVLDVEGVLRHWRTVQGKASWAGGRTLHSHKKTAVVSVCGLVLGRREGRKRRLNRAGG